MTYLKRSNKSNNKSRALAFFIISLLILVTAIQFSFPTFWSGVFYPITSFMWKGQSSIGGWFGTMADIAGSKYALVKENERLTQELASRDVSVLLLDSVQKENTDLKQFLGRTSQYKDVLGVVLVRSPQTPYDTLILDVGTNDGVSVGDKVYAEGNALVGDVSEVYSNTSKISLFSTPGREVSVLIGSSTIAAQALGKGSGNFTARLPVESGVKEGDSVLLPQLRSHVFAIVEKVEPDSTNSIATLFFKMPVNIDELRFVEVEITHATSR